MKVIPEWAALPLMAAALLEFPFYLLPGFEQPRSLLASIGRIRAACILTASTLIPYLVYSIATGVTRPAPAFLLLLVAAAVSFWYIVWPAAPLSDALFLMLLAAIILTKIFTRIYVSPVPQLSSETVSFLGHVMLIRTAALAILIIRGGVKVRFRFLPGRGDWITGFRYFAWLLPPVGVAYWALGLARPRAHPLNILLAAATFLGVLWVIALSEEFFFRGLLQQWIEQWTGRALPALITASLLFGGAHLGFRNRFPNWRFATVAAIAGFFYGLAWRRSRSVQASMVAHSLTVTLWRVFFE